MASCLRGSRENPATGLFGGEAFAPGMQRWKSFRVAWRTSDLVKASKDEMHDCKEMSDMPTTNGATGLSPNKSTMNVGYHTSRPRNTRAK
eukprot:scaffold99177_cov24-Tisochrysis_lutea.AAC.2